MQTGQNLNNHQIVIKIIIIISGIYALLSHFHSLIRNMIIEPNFFDFACYYVWGDLLNKGIDIFHFERISQKTIDYLSTSAGLSLPNLSGKTYLSFIGGVNYSPAFISIMSLFSRMSFETSVIIWTILNYVALIASVLIILSALDIKLNTITLSIYSFLVFSLNPILECTAIGQSNIFILFFLSLFLWYGKKEKPYLASFFLSIIIQIKPQYGIIALLFLTKRMYKPFVSTFMFYCLISLVFLPVVEIDSYVAYYRNLLPFVSSSDITIWLNNLSLRSSALRLFGENAILMTQWIYILFTIALLLYIFKQLTISHKGTLLPTEVAIVTALALFLPPFLEEHHLAFLVLPIIVIFNGLQSLTRFWQLAFIAGYLLVALKYSLARFSTFSSGFPSLLYNGKLYGLILIGIVAFIYWKKMQIQLAEPNRSYQ